MHNSPLIRVPLSALFLLSALSIAQAQTTLNRVDPFWKANDRTSVMVAVCHIPPGNPPNAHTIDVDSRDVAAHLAHGDL